MSQVFVSSLSLLLLELLKINSSTGHLLRAGGHNEGLILQLISKLPLLFCLF